jgi:hypothetical protein
MQHILSLKIHNQPAHLISNLDSHLLLLSQISLKRRWW